MTLAERIRAVAHLNTAAPALCFDGQWHSWGATAAALKSFARLLVGANLGPGTAVGICLKNRPQHLRAVAAVLAADCCVVTINARQPRERIIEEFSRLQLRILIADVEDWHNDDVRAAASANGALLLGLDFAQPGEMRAITAYAPRADVNYHADVPGVAIEMLTSGTTGIPKRVSWAAGNLMRAILGAARLLPGTNGFPAAGEPEIKLRSSVLILWGPLVHVSGMWLLLEHLLQGRRVCVLEKFEPRTWAALVEQHKVRMAMLSPPTLRMIWDAGIPKEQLSSLEGVTSGTAPLSPDFEGAFEEAYGIPILPAYGATEFPGSGAGWTLEDHRKFGKSKLGSAGLPRPGVKLRVVSPETGESLPAGETGVVELLARSAATPDGEEPRWMRTTDLALIDDDGFLWLKGRADAVINRGGFKIPPAEVTRRLEEHPEIKEACVVGIPDARLGEVPVAAVVPRRDGHGPAPEELEEWLRQSLSPYQIPVKFVVVPELPRTPSLKVSLHQVRSLFSE